MVHVLLIYFFINLDCNVWKTASYTSFGEFLISEQKVQSSSSPEVP